MKVKKIFPILGCFALLVAGAVTFATAAARQDVKQTKAATDVGTVTVASINNSAGDHFDNNLYLTLNETTALPNDWDIKYTAAAEDEGVFINGEKQVGAIVKHANGNDIHYGLPRLLNEGETVEIKGTFATTSNGGYSFTIDYAVQRFAGDWVRALEDYDVVSLVDANLPDFTGSTINTDDMGGDYTYTTDRYALPTRKGYLGLTNSTGSYAFQFGHQKTTAGTDGWFHVLIGGRGPLFKTGHFIDFGILDIWNPAVGHALIKEMKGNGNIWSADELQRTNNFTLNWNAGERNVLEMGMIKVKNSSQHFIFFKVNDILKFSDYWTLDSDPMTTKVTLQYAFDDATVTNTIDPASSAVKLHTSDGTMGGLYTSEDICPGFYSWDDFFMSTTKDGLKLNGVAFGNDKWNYFKKLGATAFFLDLAGAGAGSSFTKGDILYIGGMFKAAKIIDENVRVLYKVVFADSYFEYDGTQWNEVDPNYSAVEFSKDLLKQTLAICTGEGGNNGAALTTVWATLNSLDYYKKLIDDEKVELAAVAVDSTIVVPNTSAGVDAMGDADALAAAMYRYEYCTAKYSLTEFIVGRTVSPTNVGLNIIDNSYSSNAMVVIAIITVSICAFGLSIMVFSKKRKNDF